MISHYDIFAKASHGVVENRRNVDHRFTPGRRLASGCEVATEALN